MTNQDVASVLQETADLVELTDGNPHRARAFARAARSIGELDVPVTTRTDEGTLTEIRGIGDAMADHVADILASGTFPLHDELLNAVPPGLLDVLRVKGLGTKRARRLWQELDVTSLDDLEAAAEADRITDLKGFGTKTQEKILTNLRQLRSYDNKWRMPEAWSTATDVLDALRSLDAVDRAEPAGAVRRHRETVEGVDLVVASEAPDALARWLDAYVDADVEREAAPLTTTAPSGVPLRLHVAPPDRFGTAWWRATGTADHCDALAEACGTPGDHPTEEALFEAAGLPVIPPELREDRGEVAAASTGDLPSLLTADDLHGCLHNHSTYSDGSASLRQMAETARSLGYEYFGISDHSQSLRIANGLPPDRLREQHEEVRRLNDEMAGDADGPFRLLHGIESDVLADGALDYEDDLLAMLDFVVASVHTGFDMTEAEATERVVRAVRNPHTRILGHPTGRLLLSREGYPLDHERVIEACAEQDVAIELNANPYRLDLDWRWIRKATEQGVLISINPDAHAPDELRNVAWGVRVARKGWLAPKQCLNTKPLADFEAWLDRTPTQA